MKILLLIVTTCIYSFSSYAQWTTSGTNIYNTNTGNVGIGTTNPATKLFVNTASIADGLQLEYTSGTGFVRLTANNLASGYLNPITMANDGAIIFGASTIDAITTGFVIAPYRSTMGGLRMDNNGNIGINTNNTQGYKLAVNGSAIFTSAVVKLYANWPDYVFNKNYRLPSLDSLGRYIAQNHHLPDMPTSETVQSSGINLGETQAALLKKVEELTLYVVAQNKRLEAQEAKIQRLERAVKKGVALGKRK